MSIFDPSTFSMPAPRPVCPECGGGMGRGGETPGRTVRPHNRFDQAMRVDVGNPCPGAGEPSIDADEFITLNDRLRATRLAAERKADRAAAMRNV